jgi:hypothetical protein
MANFNTYSPDRVIVTFAGMIINGFAPDTFVEIERDEDGFMKYVGSLGDVARTHNLNRAGKVTLTLMAVAPINDSLSQYAIVDEIDGDAFGELMVKDLSGNMVCHAEIAWVLKWPKIERGKESGTIQWVIDCADIEVFPGGNIL